MNRQVYVWRIPENWYKVVHICTHMPEHVGIRGSDAAFYKDQVSRNLSCYFYCTSLATFISYFACSLQLASNLASMANGSA